jgi:chemosensory pili system protein ChpA (sensor histidine kinase/response regulator)
MAGGTEQRRAQVREALQRLREDAAAVARSALGERPAAVAEGAAPVAEPVDDDILEVFLEEAAEQLAALRAAQAAWRNEPGDRETLAAMAAALQNLKGPSRLVGAFTLGELAWAVEAVVRRLAESGSRSDAGIVGLVDDGVAGLEALARSYRTGEPVAQDPREVEARAYRWLSTGVLDLPASSPSARAAAAESSRRSGATSENAPAVDAELGTLLAAEADDLLDELGESLDDLDQRPGGASLAHARRALEALSASARMTRVLTLATTAETLHALLDASGASPRADTLALVREAAAAMRGTVDALRDGRMLEIPADLVGRLHAARQAAEATFETAPAPPVVRPDGAEDAVAATEPAAPAEPPPLRWLLDAPHPYEAPAGGVRARRTVRVLRDLVVRLDGEARALAGQQMRLEAGMDGLRAEVWHLRALAARLQRAAAARAGGPSGLPEDLAELGALTDAVARRAREVSGLLGGQRNIAEGLQSATTGLRRVELASRLPLLQRVLRRTAKALEKSVALRVAGDSHLVERELLDQLTPCLAELVRNAVAHGVEAPDARRAAGKPESAAVVLECVEEGAMLALSVADDGMGLDAIAAATGEPGPPGQALSSLTAEVAAPEGRGNAVHCLRDVAAVVRTLGGSVEVASWPGTGTRITLRVPHGATQRGVVLVRVGDTVYALPDRFVAGIDRLCGDAEARASGAHHVVCHGEQRRLVDLADLLPGTAPAPPAPRGRRPLLLLRLPGEPVALAVDALVDSRRVVVDPLPPPLTSIPWLVGGTILGGGRVALVLDVPTLLRGTALG